MDEHVDYSILLKTAVWLLPVAQLPQSSYKKEVSVVAGRESWTGCPYSFGLGIARPCRKEYFCIGEEYGRTCCSLESDHSKQYSFFIDMTVDSIFTLLWG